MGISPILAYLLWHWSIVAVWAGFGAAGIGFVFLIFQERRGAWLPPPALPRHRLARVGGGGGWILLGTVSRNHVQVKNRLYFSLAVAHDYNIRSAVAAAIGRTGVPPANPFFFPGRSFPLRYHYFWSILCALTQIMGGSGISARQAVLGGTIWSGIGLIAIFPLYLRFFQPKGRENLERRMLIGVGLLGGRGVEHRTGGAGRLVFQESESDPNTALLAAG